LTFLWDGGDVPDTIQTVSHWYSIGSTQKVHDILANRQKLLARINDVGIAHAQTNLRDLAAIHKIFMNEKIGRNEKAPMVLNALQRYIHLWKISSFQIAIELTKFSLVAIHT
jgi:hypothetical protein